MYTPDYDTDADYVLVSANGKNGNRIHHRVSPDDPDMPACESATQTTRWRRQGYAKTEARGTKLCGHCAGRETAENSGCRNRRLLLEASPEELGLGPWPPEEPLPSPPALPDDEAARFGGAD